jgi:hypothetical protein
MKQSSINKVRLVEAYVFRRAICAIPTNSMNKTFATFGKALKEGLLPREHPRALPHSYLRTAASPAA